MRRRTGITIAILAAIAWLAAIAGPAAAFDVCTVYTAAVTTGTPPVVQDVSLPTGFGTPTAVLAIDTAGFIDTEHHQARMCIGFSDGSTNRCSEAQARDDYLTSDTYRYNSAAYSLYTMEVGSGIQRSAATISFLADTLRITWDDTPTAAEALLFVVFTGTEEVWIGPWTHDYDVDGEYKSKSDMGGTPSLIFATGTYSAFGSYATHAWLTFGVAVNDGSETQKSFTYFSDDAIFTGSQCGAIYDSNQIAKPVDDVAYFPGLFVDSFDANGFTTRIDDASSGKDVSYLNLMAIRLPATEDVHLMEYQVPSSTGPQSHTGAGFAPKLQVVCQTHLATKDTRADDDKAACFAIAAGSDIGGSNELSQGYRDEDGADPTVTWNQAYTSIVGIDDYDGVGSNEADTDSYDSDGVTWNWTNVDFTLRYGFVLFVGERTTTVLNYERGTPGVMRGVMRGVVP